MIASPYGPTFTEVHRVRVVVLRRGVLERHGDTTLAVGRGNPAASDLRTSFDTLGAAHFDVFAWRGSLGARRMPAIAADRERALQRIAGLHAMSANGEAPRHGGLRAAAVRVARPSCDARELQRSERR
jgi:hypothetical protein